MIGDLNHALLLNVGQEPKGTIPHVAFMLFQGMFAMISPALITGAFAERVNFKGWLLIMMVWSLVVYAPVCHWVWRTGGWIAAHGGLDSTQRTESISAHVAMKYGMEEARQIRDRRPQ